ncbi:DNA primase family protein [Limnoglobus roseus]|uniref:Peptidase n=1 Tax=Limnoglobus roseus TaxID=2598579 RepID=A0A5C1AIA8_9BACT|nr:phage/plasmid primase, P4 family [Limnoglobus roseus]QEL17412.1 peptidase [Limnoglobus roseus]
MSASRQRVADQAAKKRAGRVPADERLLHPLSDIGNAARLIADHGEDVRYVGDWGCWAAFDGVRWVRDGVGASVQERAKATVKNLLTEAVVALKAAVDALADAKTEEEEAKAKKAETAAKAMIAHAKKSHDIRKIRDMLSAAKSDPRVFIPVGSDVFDKRRDLLNCPNGTVDLRTEQLTPHRREDYLTTLCPIRFVYDAPRPLYLKFLDDIFPDSPNVADYLRALAGYMLTGEVTDQAVYLLVGDGSNGKTVWLELLLYVLGLELTYTVPAEVLLDASGNRHPTERAGFRGARLAVASETQEETALNESRIKNLTGGDTMTARYCRQDFFSFSPTHKMALATNHRPRVRGTDNGIWRRIRFIEFPRRFWTVSDQLREPKGVFKPEDKADPHLLERLKAEGEGVLADMVQAARWFYAGNGTIEPPAEIAHATAAYRKDEDTLGRFFMTKTQPCDEPNITGAELRDSYVDWNRANGHTDATLIGSRKFFERAAKLFGKPSKSSVMMYRCKLKHVDPLADPKDETEAGAGGWEGSTPNPGKRHTPGFSGFGPNVTGESSQPPVNDNQSDTTTSANGTSTGRRYNPPPDDPLGGIR